MVEQEAVNFEVVGSNPTPGAKCPEMTAVSLLDILISGMDLNQDNPDSLLAGGCRCGRQGHAQEFIPSMAAARWLPGPGSQISNWINRDENLR